MKLLALKIIHFLARRVIKKYQPIVIAITGSVGKTRAKDAVAAVLAAKFKVRKSEGNYNSQWGVPLTIIGGRALGKSIWRWLKIFFKSLSLLAIKKDYPRLLVLEMAADKEGDIAELLAIVTPQIAVITAVAPAHLQQFKTIENVAREKGRLFRSIGRDGWLVVNADDETVAELARNSQAQKKYYSLYTQASAEIKAAEIKVKYSDTGKPLGLTFKIITANNVTPVLLAEVIGPHQVYPAAIAAAVGAILGVNNVETSEALGRLPPLPGRMRLLPGIKNTLIVDDSYNSSPAALREGLQAVAGLETGGRRIAVLGDMLELGSTSEDEHQKAGRLAASLGFDLLITIGERARGLANAALAAGMNADRIFEFADAAAAKIFVQERMKQGDVVFVKGSRGTHLEIVVKEIMRQPEKAGEYLVH